jgi:hypothetical protein
MRLLVQWLIDWPERVARHLDGLAPLFARMTVGWVFLWSGWGKLLSLPQVTENFIGWGYPGPAAACTPRLDGVIPRRPLFTRRPVHAHFGGSAGRHDDCRDPLSKVG